MLLVREMVNSLGQLLNRSRASFWFYSRETLNRPQYRNNIVRGTIRTIIMYNMDLTKVNVGEFYN